MKNILLCFVFLSLFSCKEKDLSEKNDPVDHRNVSVAGNYYYGEEPLQLDSLYTNNIGNQFYITEIKTLVSNFRFAHRNSNDTTTPANDYIALSMAQAKATGVGGRTFGNIEPGGYSGELFFDIGLDSLQTIDAMAITPPENSGLSDKDLVRNDRYGFNAMIIRGNVLDPNAPLDSSVLIPFEYVLGGHILHKTIKSKQVNFSIGSSTVAKFFVQIDPMPALHYIDILKIREIVSDPTDANDIALAEAVLDTVNITLY